MMDFVVFDFARVSSWLVFYCGAHARNYEAQSPAHTRHKVISTAPVSGWSIGVATTVTDLSEVDHAQEEDHR